MLLDPLGMWTIARESSSPFTSTVMGCWFTHMGEDLLSYQPLPLEIILQSMDESPPKLQQQGLGGGRGEDEGKGDTCTSLSSLWPGGGVGVGGTTTSMARSLRKDILLRKPLPQGIAKTISSRENTSVQTAFYFPVM